MNRHELKQLWFNIDYSNVKERKEIIVETKHGHVEILSEGPNGFSSFKTRQDFPMEYLKTRKEYKSGEYKLIIK
tara:strand:+ start:325 stop:546 length:222 start_codon:yes stop_codon:yes gene_type:complete